MQRVADDVARVTVVGMIVVSVPLLLLPLAMTLSMSFDARDYLGAFPAPELSLRWDAKFFSAPYLLKGLSTSLELAALTALAASVLGLCRGRAESVAQPTCSAPDFTLPVTAHRARSRHRVRVAHLLRAR